MSTILFDSPVFGPVKSRRLGISLGINLLPAGRKICSFDCLYCECGFNGGKFAPGEKEMRMPSREEVREGLEEALKRMAAEGQLPDVITFAGNGEPTLHPEFEGIMEDTAELRDRYARSAKIAVLSNATRIAEESVVRGLAKADDAILKIDAGTSETIETLDRPVGRYDIDDTIYNISMAKATLGERLVIQTMFVRWKQDDGTTRDNTSGADVEKWVEAIEKIAPARVMIYTIARDTARSGMEKVSVEEMKEIAKRIEGIAGKVEVSG